LCSLEQTAALAAAAAAADLFIHLHLLIPASSTLSYISASRLGSRLRGEIQSFWVVSEFCSRKSLGPCYIAAALAIILLSSFLFQLKRLRDFLLFFAPAIIPEVRVFVFEAKVLSEFGNPYLISVTLSRIHLFFCADTKLFFSQEFCVFLRGREREREKKI